MNKIDKTNNFWQEFEKIDTSHQTARKDFLIKEVPNWSFEKKLEYSKQKIREFIDFCKKNKLGEPVVSFSGGRDSTVLYYLVQMVVKENRRAYKPKIIVASEFFNPDNAKLIKKLKTSKSIIYPAKKSFRDIIDTIGFPIISKELSQKIRGVLDCKTNGKWIATCFGYGKGRAIPKKYLHLLDTTFCSFKPTHECCNLLKGSVKHDKQPKFVGTTVFESELRRTNWLTKGCNILSKDSPMSRPISLWNDSDIRKFIEQEKIKISEAYNKGWLRTGCMFCGFGLNIEASLLATSIKKNCKQELLDIPKKLKNKQFRGLILKNYITKMVKNSKTKSDIKKFFIEMIDKID